MSNTVDALIDNLSGNYPSKNMIGKEHPAYPELRTDYTFVTGLLGEFCANVALEDLGYKVNFNHSPNANGVDINVGDIGIEVWNHSQPHLYYERVESTKKNLKPFKHKYVFTSYIAEPVRVKLEDDNIHVITTGFQILVNDKTYLDFYKREKGKKHLTHKTIKIIKNLLRSQLYQQQTEVKSKLPLAYVYNNDVTINSVYSSGNKIRFDSSYELIFNHCPLSLGVSKQIFNRINAKFDLRSTESRQVKSRTKLTILKNKLKVVRNKLNEIDKTDVWLNELATKLKLVEEHWKRDTLKRYRQCGQLLLQYGYEKGKWNKRVKHRLMELTGYKKSTLYYMINLAKKTEKEFSSILDNYPNLNAWIKPNRSFGRVLPVSIKSVVIPKEIPVDRFVSEEEAINFFMMFGGEYLGLFYHGTANREMIEGNEQSSVLKKIVRRKR